MTNTYKLNEKHSSNIGTL